MKVCVPGEQRGAWRSALRRCRLGHGRMGHLQSRSPGCSQGKHADDPALGFFRVLGLRSIAVGFTIIVSETVSTLLIDGRCHESGESDPRVTNGPCIAYKEDTKAGRHTAVTVRCAAWVQAREPAPEGNSPVDAKAARIEHTLSALDKLPGSYTGALSCACGEWLFSKSVMVWMPEATHTCTSFPARACRLYKRSPV